jgi:hypothetical protein
LVAAYRQTRAEFSVTILEADSSGWAKENSPALAAVDPQELAERASNKAILSRNPRALDPGPWTVILEPAAVLDLVGFLFYDFAATAVRDKRSCFTGRLGKKLMGDNITLWDDAFHPLQTGTPYDGEGVPRRAEESGLFAIEREEDEDETDGPRFFAAQRMGRSALQSCVRRRQRIGGGNGRFHRARDSCYAALVYPRSGSV